jgi:hypothetical protein
VLGDRRSRVQIPPARPPFRWSAFPSAMLAASSSPQLVRPCLDCGNPTHEGTRCPQCRRARDREKYERGRSTDLPGWRKISRRVREQWIDQRGLVCPSFERPAHSVPHISKITVHKIDPWNPHGPLRRLLLRLSQPRRRRATKPATTRGSTRIFGMESRRVPRLNPEAHNTVKDALTRKARGPVVLRNLPPPVPPGREIQRWGDVTSPGAVSSVALWSRSLTRGRFPASGLAGVGEWTAICPTRKAGGPRSCHTASRLPLVPEGFWRIPQRGVLIMGVLPRVIHDAGHACGVTCDTRRRARFFGRGSGFAPRSRRSHSWGVNGFP